MPDQPNEPNMPVLGGMKTFQLACAISGCFKTNAPATAMNTKTATNFTKTTTVLKFADSLIPMMRSVDREHCEEGDQVKLGRDRWQPRNLIHAHGQCV